MRILAIDTTGTTASVAITRDVGVLGEISLDLGMTHSQTIMPALDALLTSLELSVNDMDYFACCSGPGSFTGLRIGAAAVKGLAFGANKEIVPVSTLDALAYNVFESTNLIVPVMDAKRGQVYTALYRCEAENGTQTRITGYMAEDINTVFDILSRMDARAVFTGDGVLTYGDTIREHGHFTASPHLRLQRAASTALLALDIAKQGGAVKPDAFKLDYIRRPQAEREWEQRGAGNEKERL